MASTDASEWIPTLRPKSNKQAATGAASFGAVGGVLGWSFEGGFFGTTKGALIGGLAYFSAVILTTMYDLVSSTKDALEHPGKFVQNEGDHLWKVTTGQEDPSDLEHKLYTWLKWTNPGYRTGQFVKHGAKTFYDYFF